jgi:putative oxidoreductase
MDRVDSALIVIGRILFALIFVVAAPRHFSNEGIQHAASLGVPWARVLVPISGALAIAGGLMVASGFRGRLGACLLILFLVPVTLSMHRFWLISDPVNHRLQIAMFAKNISMLGTALLLTGKRFWAG